MLWLICEHLIVTLGSALHIVGQAYYRIVKVLNIEGLKVCIWQDLRRRIFAFSHGPVQLCSGIMAAI